MNLDPFFNHVGTVAGVAGHEVRNTTLLACNLMAFTAGVDPAAAITSRKSVAADIATEAGTILSATPIALAIFGGHYPSLLIGEAHDAAPPSLAVGVVESATFILQPP